MAISSAMGNAIVPESYGFRNKIINGNFMINQRGYTSGSNLASGAYGFDRWKSNYTNTALTFTSAPQGQLVTISASGVVRQIIERANIQPGSYVLSWKGTATGRVYNEGGSAPSYATGPLSVYLDGTANVIVEFTPASGTATLGDVQLELGSRATPFEFRPVGQELEICKRYFIQVAFSLYGLPGFCDSSTSFICCMDFPTEMRSTPTLDPAPTPSNFEVRRASVSSSLASVITLGATKNGARLTVTSSSLTAGQGAVFTAVSGTQYLYFSAEL